MYRVGDILIGIAPRGEYYITSKDCIVKVVKVVIVTVFNLYQKQPTKKW